MHNCAKCLRLSFLIKLALIKVAKGKVTLAKFKETFIERRLKVAKYHWMKNAKKKYLFYFLKFNLNG